MSKKEDQKQLEELSYENAYTELVALVDSLESKEHPLEESLLLFERGQKLSQYCSKLLENAELRIRQISNDQLVESDE